MHAGHAASGHAIDVRGHGGRPATARFVGRPNVFVSHAWLYLFEDVLTALEAFDAACGAEAERFYWFDTFSIDEHATQSMTQTWWSTTFRCPMPACNALVPVRMKARAPS